MSAISLTFLTTAAFSPLLANAKPSSASQMPIKRLFLKNPLPWGVFPSAEAAIPKSQNLAGVKRDRGLGRASCRAEAKRLMGIAPRGGGDVGEGVGRGEEGLKRACMSKWSW